ncbi:hypothetical protein [Lewinella cohaerens]|uniref:hypothetical protein n=1 Tax=Lewinella cohaerens TaxID=70995 RepID=UPI00037DDA31|nr:hypothetical protein [Lewinella cohaerens]
MKTPLTFLFTLLMLGQLQAQSLDITKDEVRVLTDRLVTILNGKQFKGTLIVDNFVNNDGTTTELGVYLSNKVRTELINAPAVFEVIQRPTSLEAPRRRNIDLGDAADQIPRTNSYDDNTTIKDNAVDVGVDVGVDLLEGFLNRSRNPRYKGVDAIVQGKIVAFQDRYTLTITVISKKKQRSLAAVDGRVTNTSGLAALDGSVLPNPQTKALGGNGGLSSGNQGGSGNATHVFKRLHLNFELMKCVKSGSYLEIHLRLYSDGKVTKVTTLYNYGKIVSQDGGSEFASSTVHLGDIISNGNWATKELQPDTPIEVVVTFQPNEQIDVINKFQLAITADGVGDFLVEMNDIIVGY